MGGPCWLSSCGSAAGRAVGLAGVRVAVFVEVLDAVPTAPHVDVRDHFAAFGPGGELHLVGAAGTDSVAAGFD